MRRTVLVTGAGSAQASAVDCAVEAARLGFRVVATVPDPVDAPAVLSAAAEAGVAASVDVAILDVTDDAATVELVDRVEPWAVVWSPGSVAVGLIEDVPIEVARGQLEAMLLAPARLAQQVLPGMRRRGGGRVVVVSSPLGESTVPLLGWSGACRRGLVSLCYALRLELVEDAVDVVLVEPDADTTSSSHAREQLADRRSRSVRPEAYDRATAALDAAADRAAAPAEVADVVGQVLRAAHPRFRYGTPTSARPGITRLVPTSLRDRVRTVAGL
jgi:NAD(P)-dependent dehydrogenase (short-subunit alcohol dehydrogenase family)